MEISAFIQVTKFRLNLYFLFNFKDVQMRYFCLYPKKRCSLGFHLRCERAFSTLFTIISRLCWLQKKFLSQLDLNLILLCKISFKKVCRSTQTAISFAPIVCLSLPLLQKRLKLPFKKLADVLSAVASATSFLLLFSNAFSSERFPTFGF